MNNLIQNPFFSFQHTQMEEAYALIDTLRNMLQQKRSDIEEGLRREADLEEQVNILQQDLNIAMAAVDQVNLEMNDLNNEMDTLRQERNQAQLRNLILERAFIIPRDNINRRLNFNTIETLYEDTTDDDSDIEN